MLLAWMTWLERRLTRRRREREEELRLLRSELYKAEAQVRMLIDIVRLHGGDWTRPAGEAAFRERLVGPGCTFPRPLVLALRGKE